MCKSPKKLPIIIMTELEQPVEMAGERLLVLA
jgi:hypothetical protein